MRRPLGAEVYTLDELARAAGVPRDVVRAAMSSGELHPIPGTRFFTLPDCIRVAPRLRTAATAAPVGATRASWATALAHTDRRPLIVSSCAHAAIAALILGTTAGGTPIVAADDQVVVQRARLVYLLSPGPGGGGGGGGRHAPAAASRLQRNGRQSSRLTTPPIAPPPTVTSAAVPEPLPTRTIVAPIVETAADTRDADVVTPGTGSGRGVGSGLGEGLGGGTGGGPYRPGSGIDPPRLLREVKADYTEDARRRNVSGDVVMEIVVRHDGSVGDVTVLQGLGAGLDDKAVAAVRQWRFSPAHRQGEAVDVIVEVAVEFTLR